MTASFHGGWCYRGRTRTGRLTSLQQRLVKTGGRLVRDIASCVSNKIRTGEPLMRLVFAVMILGTAALAADAPPTITFHKDVLPILQRNCQSCHRPGQIAPMSFLTYQSVRPWAKAMKAAVISRKMPPWFADPQYGHFLNDRSLKTSE